MTAEYAPWQTHEYEGFEIHVAPFLKDASDGDRAGNSFTYLGYVCHPGVDAKLPGHSVAFHPGGEESFTSVDDALYEAVHVGRSIVDGTHPDLSVLSLASPMST